MVARSPPGLTNSNWPDAAGYVTGAPSKLSTSGVL
jgi:hypothetical protein